MADDLREFGLFGGGFQHTYGSTVNQRPSFFRWNSNQTKDTTFFIDNDLIRGRFGFNSINKKYGWVSESPEITFNALNFCENTLYKDSMGYENIFTYSKKLLEKNSKLFKFCPAQGSWIKEPQIYNKTKNISFVTSNKQMFSGHRLRLNIVEKFKKDINLFGGNKIDLFGRGFNEIENKEDGLKDYRFSIAIENCQYNYYFTEKLLDCFLTGTIPIYLGCPRIGDFFNLEGIIILDDKINLSELSEFLYVSKRDAIIDNFNRALKFICPENYLFKNYEF